MKLSPQRRILRIQDRAAIKRCLPVLLELRPHLSFSACRVQIERQRLEGYHLAALEQGNRIVAVAGYRFLENLAWGRFLYVDDLVTRKAARYRGLGALLMRWLLREARRHDCDALHLDSGVQRHEAHGFYLKHRLPITAYHFARRLQ
jgi:GNAT superfamily N-acetyltransferase